MKIKNAAELREAKQNRKTLAEKLASTNKPEMTDEESRAWNALKAEYDGLNGDISAYDAHQERSASLVDIEAQEQRGQQQAASQRTPAQLAERQNLRLFRNLGEQLVAVREAAFGHGVDERLNQLNAEARALGSSEGVGADGGFAVQTDFTGVMLESAVETGDILSRVDTYEVGANANGARWVEIDETSVATTVFGGVQVYWAAEATAVSASKPTMSEVKLDLEKLMGIAYATEELMQDTIFMSSLYTRAFTVAIQRILEGDIVSGDGVARLKGLLNSGALVTVNKENGQAADTFVYQNVVHMWGRLLARSRRNAVWMMHPDVEEILPLMTFPVGTGGVPVYLPPSGVADSPFARLYGRPIIPSDHCSALGDLGDVFLWDPTQYFLITKGGVQSAASIHVAFLTAENCFRFIFRANGLPKKNSALTIKNSSNPRSPYVTLQAR